MTRETILASTYVLHPDLLLQVIIDFGDKEMLSDNWEKVWSLSWEVITNGHLLICDCLIW